MSKRTKATAKTPTTEDERIRFAVGLMWVTHIGNGWPPGVARGKIVDALGSLFDGSWRKRQITRNVDVGGVVEPLVSAEGVFLMAGHVGMDDAVNFASPSVQARWSCTVREELDRLERCGHEWEPAEGGGRLCRKCWVKETGDAS